MKGGYRLCAGKQFYSAVLLEENVVMRKLFVLCGVVFLSACSVLKSEDIRVSSHDIEYSGPRNDVSAWASGMPRTKMDSDAQPGSASLGGLFPLAHAVVCNESRTVCKHGVIKTELKYEIHNVQDGVVVSGVLESRMGRSMTEEYSVSSYSKTTSTLSVPDDVELIANNSVSTPFSFVYAPGKKVVLNGLEGVKVTISFNPVENYQK
jgi:hypothetical protein